jgi:DNA-binding response OmpR family regulator
MLARRPRLVCYGHDDILLYTRKLILDKEFIVDKCGSIACLTEILSRGLLDLVLLCQSVPDAECKEVIEMVRAASPEVKVLVIQAAPPETCSLHSDATMEMLSGPHALVHEVHALLGGQ